MIIFKIIILIAQISFIAFVLIGFCLEKFYWPKDAEQIKKIYDKSCANYKKANEYKIEKSKNDHVKKEIAVATKCANLIKRKCLSAAKYNCLYLRFDQPISQRTSDILISDGFWVAESIIFTDNNQVIQADCACVFIGGWDNLVRPHNKNQLIHYAIKK